MNTPKPSEPVDIIAALKLVPDVQSRLVLVVLSVVALFVPIVSFWAKLTLLHTFGALGFALPVFAVLVLVSPIFPTLAANSRLIEMANAGAAIFAGLMAIMEIFRFGEIPSWGAIIIAAYVALSVIRGLKVVKVSAPN